MNSETLTFGQAAQVPEREQHLQLLREASREIRDLRGRLAVQDAKVATMELCASLGRQQSTRDYVGSGAYSPDVAWQIDRALERAAQVQVPPATEPVIVGVHVPDTDSASGALPPAEPVHAAVAADDNDRLVF